MGETRETRTVCCYCGVGCGVVVRARGERVVGVRGDEAHPANAGLLCSKGRELHETVHVPGRLLHPMAREAKGRPRRRVGWDSAVAGVAAAIRLASAKRGPDGLGLYLSGQLLTEDYYAFNKLARGFLGTNQIDSNSRLCMSSAVVGYQRAFGVDGPPCSYEDLDEADLLLAVGANVAWCHPVLFRRLERARARGGRRLVVLDPRRTATAEVADLHVPLRPGSDAVFLMGALAALRRRGALRRDWIARHTDGFDALEAVLDAFPPERVERECGVPAGLLARVAEWWSQARAVLSLFAMGVNQSAHGTDTVNALVNLHLATAQLGRAGAGPFSLTGQPNAMGGREVGAMATLLPAHRRLDEAGDRAELARFWGGAPAPAARGRTAVEMFEAAADGALELLWIVATNPAVTLPDTALVRRALERTPFVVVQDVCETETTRFADLVLPAAGWPEKDGTMTNSERRVSRVRAAVPPPGEALADWRIVARVAEAMGFGPAFAWASHADVWREHAASTAGRDCDLSGMTPERLEAGPLQWPCPAPDHPGTARLYTEGRFPTPSGRARFVVPRDLGPAERADAGAGADRLVLTTGRLRDQWHTMTRTGHVPELLQHAPSPRLDVSPKDAEGLGLAEGDAVRVRSAGGAFVTRVRVSDASPPGVVFAPMHFGERFASGGGPNAATHRALDPLSKQPELKHALVWIEKAAAPGGKVVIVGLGPAGVLTAEALRARDPAREIVLLGAEDHAPYDRVRLPEIVAGDAAAPALAWRSDTDWRRRGLAPRLGARVESIDRAARVVVLSSGERVAYDQLVLATGGRARVPGSLGALPPGVQSLRTLGDALALAPARVTGRRAVVLGAGPLGVEAAAALARAGAPVTLAAQGDRPLRAQLDTSASALLEAALRMHGVRFRGGAKPAGFARTGDGAVSAVRFEEGPDEPAEIVLLALGATPEVDLARRAGLRVNERIVVDAQGRSDDPRIFALGECAEHEGRTSPLVSTTRAQARTVAAVLAGDESARFPREPAVTVLKIPGLTLRCCGVSSADGASEAAGSDPESRELVLSDLRRGLYRKLVLRRERVVGFTAVGPFDGVGRWIELARSGLRVPEPAEALLVDGSEGGDANEEARGALVCACRGVRAGRIHAAIAQGARSVDAVAERCGAGAGCGSCRPEVARLLRVAGEPDAARAGNQEER